MEYSRVEGTHAVLPILEYSMPVSSPAAPGLTSPRALCSRVLQALGTSEDVRRVPSGTSEIHYSGLESFECIDYSSEYFSGCIEAMR